MVLSWKDKRLVKFISTKHDVSMVTIQRRKKGGHSEMEQVKKPACICNYNKNMSGVDHIDQMIFYYPCTRKTLKWAKKVFFYLMELTVHNSHVLYKAVTKNEKMKLYDFQMDIIQRLCHVDPFVQNACTDSYENDHPPSKAPRHDPISRLSSGFKSHHITSLRFLHPLQKNIRKGNADSVKKMELERIQGIIAKNVMFALLNRIY